MHETCSGDGPNLWRARFRRHSSGRAYIFRAQSSWPMGLDRASTRTSDYRRHSRQIDGGKVIDLKSFIFAEVVPLPAPEDQINPPAIFEKYDNAVDAIGETPAAADDPKLLDLSLKLFDNDANHRASIDARAAAMMSAITLAATLVTGVGFTMFRDTSGLPVVTFWAMFLSFVFTLIYLTATIILLFQIHGRIIRFTPDPTDLATPLPAPNQLSSYPRQIAVRVLRYTVGNYSINNRVLVRLWVAQKCFRNALVVLVLGGLLTTMILMSSTHDTENGLRLAQALARKAGCTDLPSLTADRQGRWKGSCLFQGRPTRVLVNDNGNTEFSP